MKAEPFGNEIMVTNAFLLVRTDQYMSMYVCTLKSRFLKGNHRVFLLVQILVQSLLKVKGCSEELANI